MNAGESGVYCGFRADRLALLDPARVTVMVYVLMVVPLGAVTTTLTVLAPTLSAIGADLVPEASVVPFTFIVALPSLVTGATVMLVVV